MRTLLISLILLPTLAVATKVSNDFESNLVKGGKYRCYENGDALLCFSSLCANALFEEMRNETSTTQRQRICKQEGKSVNFVGRHMLRAMTNPNFAREFKGVIP